jgi:hypothetical protein
LQLENLFLWTFFVFAVFFNEISFRQSYISHRIFISKLPSSPQPPILVFIFFTNQLFQKINTIHIAWSRMAQPVVRAATISSQGIAVPRWWKWVLPAGGSVAALCAGTLGWYHLVQKHWAIQTVCQFTFHIPPKNSTLF